MEQKDKAFPFDEILASSTSETSFQIIFANSAMLISFRLVDLVTRDRLAVECGNKRLQAMHAAQAIVYICCEVFCIWRKRPTHSFFKRETFGYSHLLV